MVNISRGYITLIGIPEAEFMTRPTNYYYYYTEARHVDEPCMYMGYSFEENKHWAIGRLGKTQEAFVVVKDELNAREYL